MSNVKESWIVCIDQSFRTLGWNKISKKGCTCWGNWSEKHSQPSTKQFCFTRITSSYLDATLKVACPFKEFSAVITASSTPSTLPVMSSSCLSPVSPGRRAQQFKAGVLYLKRIIGGKPKPSFPEEMVALEASIKNWLITLQRLISTKPNLWNLWCLTTKQSIDEWPESHLNKKPLVQVQLSPS